MAKLGDVQPTLEVANELVEAALDEFVLLREGRHLSTQGGEIDRARVLDLQKPRTVLAQPGHLVLERRHGLREG